MADRKSGSMRRGYRATLAALLAIAVLAAPSVQAGASRASNSPSTPGGDSLLVPLGRGQLTVALVDANIVRVQFRASQAGAAKASAADTSLVLDPAWRAAAVPDVRRTEQAFTLQLDAPGAHVIWDKAQRELRIEDAGHHLLLRQHDLAALAEGKLLLTHDAHDPMYGIGGYNAFESAAVGLLRQGRQLAAAGAQGHPGAPFVWSTAGYGLLVNSQGVDFTLQNSRLDVQTPLGDIDYFIVLGKPAQIFAAIARLSGHTPLFPKWAMGFTNSQWGIDEKALLSIVDTYRRKHIPIENFTLDFDWKAWGEDH